MLRMCQDAGTVRKEVKRTTYNGKGLLMWCVWMASQGQSSSSAGEVAWQGKRLLLLLRRRRRCRPSEEEGGEDYIQ